MAAAAARCATPSLRRRRNDLAGRARPVGARPEAPCSLGKQLVGDQLVIAALLDPRAGGLNRGKSLLPPWRR
ncbi:hypothetical protein C7I55_12575 [Sphingomonas deserti]|uniref:Uncharacterized protein n=1 Tax=Allosphingosinicella deserti TaxID=2116704 RepID=A0A2P7QNB8_9SPHN|nr:hypothetical protein C7I55_12575 [Sphingomonas deserti]